MVDRLLLVSILLGFCRLFYGIIKAHYVLIFLPAIGGCLIVVHFFYCALFWGVVLMINVLGCLVW